MPKSIKDLTPESLVEAYIHQGLTEFQIAELYGTYQVKINRLRKTWGIPTICKAQRLGLPSGFSDRQRSLLIGSMLGDARLFRVGRDTAILSEYHCSAQQLYLEWKSEEWGPYFNSCNPARKGPYTGYRMVTHSAPSFFPYWEMFYPEGKGNKAFELLPLEWVDSLALAVWFMDDGSKSGRYFRLHVGSDSGSYAQQLRILHSFGLDARAYRERGGHTLFLHDRSSVQKFADLVEPHMHPSLLYKLDVQSPVVSSVPVEPFLGGPAIHLPEDPEKVVDTLVHSEAPIPAPSEEEIRADWDRLQRLDVDFHGGKFGSNQGTRLCSRFFRHRWEARYEGNPSVLEAWKDRSYLEKAVAFQLSVGDPLTSNRVFRALQAVVRAPTNFRPGLAKAIVSAYSPKNGVVLDPCAGYGGRAAGTVAAGRFYVGVDPHPKARQSFREMRKIVSPLKFYPGAFEDVDLGDLLVDLVFTSPPYFSKERYSDNQDQSWVRYPSWESWIGGFLTQLVLKSYRHLKDEGYLVINTKDVSMAGKTFPIAQKVKELAVEAGFVLEASLEVTLGRLGRTTVTEPLLVFRKSDKAPETTEYTEPAPPPPPSSMETTLRELYLVKLQTDSEIAESLGISDVRVSQLRKMYRIPTLTAQERAEKLGELPSFSSLDRATLSDLYAQMGDSRLAAQFGVSKTAVRLKRKKLGVESIPRRSRYDT